MHTRCLIALFILITLLATPVLATDFEADVTAALTELTEGVPPKNVTVVAVPAENKNAAQLNTALENFAKKIGATFSTEFPEQLGRRTVSASIYDRGEDQFKIFFNLGTVRIYGQRAVSWVDTAKTLVTDR